MNLSSTELKSLLSAGDGITLLDVRTPAEYDEVHIPGSKLLPLDRLDPGSAGSLHQGAGPCVLICRTGGRAAQAARKLEGKIPQVAVLEGGVQAWTAAGYPVNRGRAAVSLERQVRIAAGTLVLLGVLLSLLVHPGWVALSAFVGAGLVFAGATDWCGMGLLLARMPWNRRARRPLEAGATSA